MRIIVNEAYIQKRVKLGERAPFVGLVLVAIATAIIFFMPDWWWLTMIFVVLGFITSTMGSYLGERYLGPLAHHTKVPEALKGLDDRYSLLIYKTPVPFVLVDPGGVTTVTVQVQGGDVVCKEGKWRHREKLGWLRRFVGQESLGRPHRIAAAETGVLQDFLKSRLPADVDVPLRSLILFVNPDLRLEVGDCPVKALRAAELKRWLRKDGVRSKLTAATMQQLLTALEGEV